MTDYVHKVSDDEARRIQRFLYGVAIGTVAFVVLIIVAVATARTWVTVIGHDAERRFIAPHVEWVNEHLLDPGAPVLQKYVEDLGREIAAGMDLPPDLRLDFFVIEGSSGNAFATLGGYIFVLDGLVRELDDENSLAMVLAHEIAHAKNRDPLSGASRGILLQVMISALSGSGGIDVAASTETGFEMLLNTYSRAQEQAADRIALEALQDHYGHVGGATTVFETLAAVHGDSELPEIFSSHPHLSDRIAALHQVTAERGWSSGATDPYPAEVLEALSSRL
jgi:Zn-dependent protease with chaperone function